MSDRTISKFIRDVYFGADRYPYVSRSVINSDCVYLSIVEASLYALCIWLQVAGEDLISNALDLLIL